jgi:hypothetical protein
MDKFLSHTDTLINHIYWFKQDLRIRPAKEHLGSAINWTDITDRKNDFLRELVNTVTSWVYHKKKVQDILEQRLKLSNGDLANAAGFLNSQAFSKFRPGSPQGQFGELLLFNFIQHFFRAVPLLRKQRITTSIGHERFGADAIHFKKDGEKNCIFLGESKCYESSYQFKKAFEASLSSIVTTVTNFNKELDLYVYDDFIEPELEEIAKKYKNNELKNVQFELVCIIAYDETNKITGKNEQEIKQSIKSIIENRCGSIEQSCFDSIEGRILERINYVVFPIWNLDTLLDEFQTKVGK